VKGIEILTTSPPSPPRDPGDATRRRRARLAVWGLGWALFTAALGLLYTAIPPSPDQALFDYIGWRILEGATPYADVAELNWPGAMFLHTAAVAIFGNTIHAWRAFDYGYLLATLCVVFAVVRALAGTRVGFVTVVVYQILYVTGGVWFSGQRDILGAPLLLVAVFAQTRALERRSVAWQALAGPAIAFAMLLKPTLGAIAVLLAVQVVHAFVRGRVRFGRAVIHLATTGASLLLTLLLFGAVARAWGFLDDWWEICFVYNGAVYTQDSVAFAELGRRIWRYAVPSWHWLLIASAAGLAALLRRGQARLAWTALALLGATAISIVVQQKGFGYHLGPALLALALLAGALLELCLRTVTATPRRVRAPAFWIAAAVLLVAFAGLAAKLKRELLEPLKWRTGTISRMELLTGFSGGDAGVTMADVAAAADYLEARTAPDEPVLLWGRSVLTQFLARRRSPTRFCHAYMLWSAREEYRGSEAWIAEFKADLAAAPPSFILLTRDPEGGHVWVEEGAESVELLLETLRGGYRKVAQFGGLEAFRRIERAPADRRVN